MQIFRGQVRPPIWHLIFPKWEIFFYHSAPPGGPPFGVCPIWLLSHLKVTCRPRSVFVFIITCLTFKKFFGIILKKTKNFPQLFRSCPFPFGCPFGEKRIVLIFAMAYLQRLIFISPAIQKEVLMNFFPQKNFRGFTSLNLIFIKIFDIIYIENKRKEVFINGLYK